MHLACGTLSYREAPLERALEGICKAGFRAVELGCVCGYCEHIRPEAMDRSDVKRLADLLQKMGLEVMPRVFWNRLAFDAGADITFVMPLIDVLELRAGVGAYSHAKQVQFTASAGLTAHL